MTKEMDNSMCLRVRYQPEDESRSFSNVSRFSVGISVNRLLDYPSKLQIFRIIGSLYNFITKYRNSDNHIVIGENTFVYLSRPVYVLVITCNGLPRWIRHRTRRYRYGNRILEKIRNASINEASNRVAKQRSKVKEFQWYMRESAVYEDSSFRLFLRMANGYSSMRFVRFDDTKL